MPDSKRSGALKDETTGTILSSGDERQSLDPGMRRITARKSSIARCDETFLTGVSSGGRNALRNLFQVSAGTRYRFLLLHIRQRVSRSHHRRGVRCRRENALNHAVSDGIRRSFKRRVGRQWGWGRRRRRRLSGNMEIEHL